MAYRLFDRAMILFKLVTSGLSLLCPVRYSRDPRSGQLSHQHRGRRLARTPCFDGLPNNFGDIDSVKAF